MGATNAIMRQVRESISNCLMIKVAEEDIVASKVVLPGGSMMRSSVSEYAEAMRERYRAGGRAEKGCLLEWEELRVTQDVANQLCQLSASTIDRLLRPHKDRGLRRPWSTTKPGSLLKASIPIRTFAEWDEGPSRVHRGGPGGPLWGHDRGVLPEHPDGGGHSHGLGGVSGSLG